MCSRYKEAVDNPGKIVVVSPYKDVVGDFITYTFAKTIIHKR